MLYFVDSKKGGRRAVLPEMLRKRVIEESHRGPMGGHFSGQRIYNTESRHFWWDSMYTDVHNFVKGCPESVAGGGRVQKPPLCPIPPFQTTQGNHYVLVIQDFLSCSCHARPMSTQDCDNPSGRHRSKLWSAGESRGTNLLSHLMLDVCKLLGIQKFNTLTGSN